MQHGLPPPQPPVSSRPRPAALWLGASLAALLVLLDAGDFYLQWDFDQPADTGVRETRMVQIKPGTGMRRITKLLSEKGLIASPWRFRLQARLRGGARHIRAGFYEFRPADTPRTIYRALLDGRVVQRSFTIPEGFNLAEIARAIEASGLTKSGEILALAHSKTFLGKLGVEADSLEGYLFPDTYRFPLGSSPRQILSTMVQTLHKRFSPRLAARAKEEGLSLHQVLTLASIVEKETSLAQERPLVAAVFLNRLEKGMRLQSDPTVIYGLPAFDGNLHKRDLAHDNPYNTYMHRGLPPGPIASPGIASIRAVLYPAPVDFLYFVATKNGGHKFSRTYREHRRAVSDYQLK